jgi:hypothetical protein
LRLSSSDRRGHFFQSIGRTLRRGWW